MSTKHQLEDAKDKLYRTLSKRATRVIRLEQLVEKVYLLIARLDDDPLIPGRVREHAHLLRQEMLILSPDLDKCLPSKEAQ